jgi:hypothetical protein
MRIHLPCVLALCVTAAGCKSKSPDQRLFGDLPDPTPNQLSGVYNTIVDTAGLTTEIRLQFDGGTLSGAVHCTPKNPAFAAVDVDGAIGLDTGAIDQASGQFTVGDFQMEQLTDNVDCFGGLRGATYDFKVEGLKLTLTTKSIPEPIIYTKIGDNP